MILANLTFGGPLRIAQLLYTSDEGFVAETRSPGDGLSDLPVEVRQQIEAEWTPEVIAAYREVIKPDPEPVTRRRVDRRTIIERLDRVSLLDEAEAALLAAPALLRWKWNTAGDWVYADDPETVAFLKALGADAEVILAP